MYTFLWFGAYWRRTRFALSHCVVYSLIDFCMALRSSLDILSTTYQQLLVEFFQQQLHFTHLPSWRTWGGGGKWEMWACVLRLLLLDQDGGMDKFLSIIRWSTDVLTQHLHSQSVKIFHKLTSHKNICKSINPSCESANISVLSAASMAVDQWIHVMLYCSLVFTSVLLFYYSTLQRNPVHPCVVCFCVCINYSTALWAV